MTENAYQRAIALAVRGAVDLSWLTSDRFTLDDATEAFATAARREGLKVVVDVTS
jgi:threonine dehydrogenase-like Zn-dependent dehydrogenase